MMRSGVPRAATAMHTYVRRARGYPTRPHSAASSPGFNGRCFLCGTCRIRRCIRPVRCVIQPRSGSRIITAPYSRPISSAKRGRSIAPFICLASENRYMQSDYRARANVGSVINLTTRGGKNRYGSSTRIMVNKLREGISCHSWKQEDDSSSKVISFSGAGNNIEISGLGWFSAIYIYGRPRR